VPCVHPQSPGRVVAWKYCAAEFIAVITDAGDGSASAAAEARREAAMMIAANILVCARSAGRLSRT